MCALFANDVMDRKYKVMLKYDLHGMKITVDRLMVL
jgi:hypothetical protein